MRSALLLHVLEDKSKLKFISCSFSIITIIYPKSYLHELRNNYFQVLSVSNSASTRSVSLASSFKNPILFSAIFLTHSICTICPSVSNNRFKCIIGNKLITCFNAYFSAYSCCISITFNPKYTW